MEFFDGRLMTSTKVKEVTAPSSPASGYQAFYIDSSTHRPMLKNSAGTAAAMVRENESPTWTGSHTFNSGTSQGTAILLDMAQPGSNSQRDSHIIQQRGTNYQSSAAHNFDWRYFVDVISDTTDRSEWVIQFRKDAGSWTNQLSLSQTGVLTVDTLSASLSISEDIDMQGTFSVVDLRAPVLPGDAATKSYVDGVAQGLHWKEPVLVATTANITLSGEQTIDGFLTSASRVLVKNQSTGSQNGIYTSASGSWTRTTDADAGAELVSAAVFVTKGTANGDKAFVCTNDSVTLGSTSITWVNFSSSTGALLIANNLSDLADVPTARNNLGLGDVAVLDLIDESNMDLTDVTTLNATTLAHGFLPKLSGSEREFLNGEGAWKNPFAGYHDLPIHRWTCDENTGTTAADTGTEADTDADLTTVSTWYSSTLPTVEGGNTSSAFLSAVSSPEVPTGQLVYNDRSTLTGWFRYKGTSASGTGAADAKLFDGGAGGPQVTLQYSSSKAILVGTWNSLTFSSEPITLNGTWHMWTLRLDAGESVDGRLDFFLDGVEIGCDTDTTFLDITTANIRPTIFTGSNRYDFYIDDVRIYRAVLSKYQIKALYAGTNPVTPTLPTHASMWHDESTPEVGSLFDYADDVAEYYVRAAFQEPADVGDSFTQTFYLAKGTYDFHILGTTDDDRGIVDWYIDDTVFEAEQDWYAASGDKSHVVVSQVAVLTNGLHTLRGTVSDKNASSSGYSLHFTKYWFAPSPNACGGSGPTGGEDLEPLHWWRFDEGTGSTGADTGSGTHVNCTGIATWLFVGLPPVAGGNDSAVATGTTGGGFTSKLTWANATMIPPGAGPITFMGWFQLSSFPLTTTRLIGTSNSAHFNAFAQGSGEIMVRWASSTFTSTGTYDINENVHFAITFDKPTVKIYINGVLAGTGTISEDIPTPNEDYYSEGSFTMRDDYRIYNVVLTGTQIAAIAAGG